MLHSSPFSASLPSSIFQCPPNIPPSTAERHPASHNSSLEHSQGSTAASCNTAKSDSDQRERENRAPETISSAWKITSYSSPKSLCVWVPAEGLKLALIRAPYRKHAPRTDLPEYLMTYNQHKNVPIFLSSQ